LEPSPEIVLEDPSHKSPRSARQAAQLLIYRQENDEAKVSKSLISVNGKIE